MQTIWNEISTNVSFRLNPSRIINDERKKISLTTLTVKLGQLDEKKSSLLNFFPEFLSVSKKVSNIWVNERLYNVVER